MHETPRRRPATPEDAAPEDAGRPDPSGDEADNVTGTDRPDAPDAPARGPGRGEGEEAVSDTGGDGIETVHEADPDAWIDADPSSSPDEDGASRPGAP